MLFETQEEAQQKADEIRKQQQLPAEWQTSLRYTDSWYITFVRGPLSVEYSERPDGTVYFSALLSGTFGEVGTGGCWTTSEVFDNVRAAAVHEIAAFRQFLAGLLKINTWLKRDVLDEYLTAQAAVEVIT